MRAGPPVKNPGRRVYTIMSSPVVGGGGAQVGKVVSPGAFPIVDGSPGNKGSTLPDSHSPVAEEGEAARVHPAYVMKPALMSTVTRALTANVSCRYRPHALRPHAVLPVGASLPLRSLRGSRELAAATAFSQETQHLLQSTYSRLNKRDAPPALRMGRDKAPADVATVHHPEWAHIEHTTEVRLPATPRLWRTSLTYGGFCVAGLPGARADPLRHRARSRGGCERSRERRNRSNRSGDASGRPRVGDRHGGHSNGPWGGECTRGRCARVESGAPTVGCRPGPRIAAARNGQNDTRAVGKRSRGGGSPPQATAATRPRQCGSWR